MNKNLKLKVLAFGVFATLALSSCGNGTKKADANEKATNDTVTTEQVAADTTATEQVAQEEAKEEGCGGNCQGCPNAGKC